MGDPIVARDDVAATSGADPITIDVLVNDSASTGFSVELTLTASGDTGVPVPLKNAPESDTCDWYRNVSATGKINGGGATITLSNFVFWGYSVSPSGDCAYGNWTGTVVIANGVELKTFTGAQLQTTMCVNAQLPCYKSTTAVLSASGLEVHFGRFLGLYPGQQSAQFKTSGYGESDAFGPPVITAIVSDPSNGTATIVGNAIQYTPFTDANLFDVFAYQITDALAQTATAVVTINKRKLNLSIYNGQYEEGNSKPVKEKVKVGAFTVANLNDTDGDGIVDNVDDDVTATAKGRDELDLMRLVISRPEDNPPDDATVTLRVLSWGGMAILWDSPQKQSKRIEMTTEAGSEVGEQNYIVQSHDFPAKDIPEDGKVLWVEATEVSKILRDITIRVTYSATDASDEVCATAIWATKEFFINSQLVTSLLTGATKGQNSMSLLSTAGLKTGDTLLVYGSDANPPDSYTVTSVYSSTKEVGVSPPLIADYAKGRSVRVGYPAAFNANATLTGFWFGRTLDFASSGFLGKNGSRYNSMVLVMRLLPKGVGEEVRNGNIIVDQTRQRQEIVYQGGAQKEEDFPKQVEAFNDDKSSTPDELNVPNPNFEDLIFARDMPGTGIESKGGPTGSIFVQLMNMRDFVRVRFGGQQFSDTGDKHDGRAEGSRASDYVIWHSLLFLKAKGAVLNPDPEAIFKDRAWVRENTVNEIAEGYAGNPPNNDGTLGSLRTLVPKNDN